MFVGASNTPPLFQHGSHHLRGSNAIAKGFLDLTGFSRTCLEPRLSRKECTVGGVVVRNGERGQCRPNFRAARAGQTIQLTRCPRSAGCPTSEGRRAERGIEAPAKDWRGLLLERLLSCWPRDGECRPRCGGRPRSFHGPGQPLLARRERRWAGWRAGVQRQQQRTIDRGPTRAHSTGAQSGDRTHPWTLRAQTHLALPSATTCSP